MLLLCFIFFIPSNVPDNKCHRQTWIMLFFTCIKLVVHVLACAIAYIKWRRLETQGRNNESRVTKDDSPFLKGKKMIRYRLNC